MVNKDQKINADLSDESKSFQERIDEVRSLVEENLRYTKTIKESGGSPESIRYQQEIRKLLEQNLKISQELHEMTKKIKHWITMQRIWTIIKIIIILIPIVLGIIYLPSLLKQALQPYQELLNLTEQTSEQQNMIEQIIGQFK